MYNSDSLFSKTFFGYRQGVFDAVRNEIARQGKASLDHEDQFVSEMLAERQLTELKLDMDSLKILPHHREEESYHTDVFGDQRRIVTPVYTFELNYTGSAVLFHISPSSSRLIRLQANIEPNKISFEIKGDDKSRLEQIKEGLKVNTDNQKAEVANFNGDLEKTIRTAAIMRKEEIGKHEHSLDSFGVPVKGEDD